LREYVARYPDPITVVAGALVRVEKDDPDFGRLRADYTARELTVQQRTPLTVLDERGGWLSVAAPDGATGWVPAPHVRRADTVPGLLA
jgi:Bacterial SH3 domain